MPKNVTIDIIKNERMMTMKDDKKKKTMASVNGDRSL
jgi:hypothetical protein